MSAFSVVGNVLSRLQGWNDVKRHLTVLCVVVKDSNILFDVLVLFKIFYREYKTSKVNGILNDDI